MQKCANPLMKNKKDEKPLDLAVTYGRVAVLKTFLDFPDHKNYLGLTRFDQSPLHLAAKNGGVAVVTMLLDAGFDVNYQVRKFLLTFSLLFLLCF